jgi:hypothetical protein
VPAWFLSGKLFTPNIAELYAAVRQPVLVFCDQSDYGRAGLLPAFAEDHGWTVRCIPGTKAMPHFERREATFREMNCFFDKLRSV